MSGRYRGIRVLDCTEGIADPTTTMHLADFGADALKVETPAGDRLRSNPGYLCWNRNKRSTRVDADNYRDLAEEFWPVSALTRFVSRRRVNCPRPCS